MAKIATNWTCFTLTVALACAACEDEMPTPGVPDGGGSATSCAPANPGQYVSADYMSNAVVELGIRAAHTAFMMPMVRAGADLTAKPTASELRALYEAGPPSLRSITTSYYAARVDEWLTAFEGAAGNMWTPAEPPPATGGKLGNDIYSRDGLDIRQAIDKGMYGAAFYNHGVSLMNGTVTPATIDRLIAIYGSHPSFGTADAGAPQNDIWAATYSKRRTNPSGATPGLYARIKTNFIAAQAAAAGGATCSAELQAALKNIREDWEKVLLATTLYYANDAKNKLGQMMVGPALHSIGEGLGFAHGFRMMPATARKITDAQIDEILALFGAPSGGPVTTYTFATDTAGTAPKLDQVIAKVKAVYGWTDAEVDSFKVNY